MRTPAAHRTSPRRDAAPRRRLRPPDEAAALGHSIEVAQQHYRRIRAEQSRAAARKVALGARPTPPTPEPEPSAADTTGNVIPIGRGKAQSG